MTRSLTQVGDVVRELNDVEHAQYLIDVKVAAKTVTEQAAQAAIKLSAYKKLAALGLTADEINALTGAN